MTDQDKPQGPTDPARAGSVETHGDDRDPEGDRERADQLENAGTSLDEPSDASGGE